MGIAGEMCSVDDVGRRLNNHMSERRKKNSMKLNAQ